MVLTKLSKGDFMLKTVLIGFYERRTDTRRNIADATTIRGGYVKREFNIVNGTSVRIPEEYVDNFINFMRNIPNIKYVYESLEAYATTVDLSTNYLSTNSNPNFNSLSANSNSNLPWGIKFIRADQVHQSGNRGAGIKVGIIDSGIDYNHPDLSPNYKGGYNFIEDNNDPLDDCGHGTHVAGTIAGKLTGVAPDAGIYSYRVLSGNTGGGCSGSSADIIDAVEMCVTNGINIINMSIGLNGSDPLLKEACDNAYNQGTLIICSAGNSGGIDDSCDTNSIGEPASYDSCVAVTALACGTNELAIFDVANNKASSRGPKAEICAPGQSISSTFVTWVTPYYSMQGTSMASPHVVGVAALVMSANPSLTNVQVRQRLQTGSIDLGSQGRDGCFGYGLIDAPSAVNNTSPPSPPPPTTESHMKCKAGNCESACGSGIEECSSSSSCPKITYICEQASAMGIVRACSGKMVPHNFSNFSPVVSKEECQPNCGRWRCVWKGVDIGKVCDQGPGAFDTQQQCQNDCGKDLKFKCENKQCIQKFGGVYASSDCQNLCKNEFYNITKYRCKDGQCVQDPDGRYYSSDCGGYCSTTIQRYSCNANGECVPDPAGVFTSPSCDGSCTTTACPNIVIQFGVT